MFPLLAIPPLTRDVGLPPITTLSFIASTTSSRSQNVTLPATIHAGDLLLYCDHGFQIPAQGGPLPAVQPSGFTILKDQGFSDSGGRRAVYSAKIADGTEDSAVVAGMVNTGGTTTAHFALCKAVLQFRADRPITAFSLGLGSDFDGSSSISTGGTRASVITSVSMLKPSLIVGWTMGNFSNPTFHLEDSTVPVEDGTQVFDDAAAAVCKVKMGHYFRQSIPVNITAIASLGGSQHWSGGFYVELE